MAAWFRTGTVSVTSGSKTVTLSGGTFIGNVEPGFVFVGPDKSVYEIASVDGVTKATLVESYGGSTVSGQSYGIIPTKAPVAAFRASLDAVLSSFEEYAVGPLDGKFPAGSASTPAVAGAGDPDTGISFPGDNRMRVSAGGDQRIEVSSDEMKVDVPLTGSAVQSDLFSTAKGKVPLVGAFGWGIGLGDNPPATADLDTTSLPSGNSIYAGGSTQNRPLGGKNGAGIVFRGWGGLADGQGELHQIFGVRAAGGADRSELLHRTLANDGTWTVWARMVHTENLLDPVAVGGVIERGIIGNDAYVRLADGTQWCFGYVDLGPGNANGGGVYHNPHYTDAGNVAFAASFSGNPEVFMQRQADLKYSITRRVINVEPYSVGPAAIGAIRAYSLAGEATPDPIMASYLAIGRWK